MRLGPGRTPLPAERQVVAEIVHEEVEHWSGVIALIESLGVPDRGG